MFFNSFLNQMIYVLLNVSDKNYYHQTSNTLTKSPDVIPVAQKIESPLTISLNYIFY